ncbi:hypothetical protein MC885_011844 [Smutsia gigantea]|nr:hypothetical protein MC885_011844 [Smutsia gigantea]
MVGGPVAEGAKSEIPIFNRNPSGRGPRSQRRAAPHLKSYISLPTSSRKLRKERHEEGERGTHPETATSHHLRLGGRGRWEKEARRVGGETPTWTRPLLPHKPPPRTPPPSRSSSRRAHSFQMS